MREDWQTVKLGEVCEKVEYGSSSKSSPDGSIPVLRMGNIQRGKFVWDNLVYTSNEEEIEKYQLEHNDVLFNRTNSAELVGKTAIYKSEQPAIFAGYLIRIHRKKNLIDGEFLNYYLNSSAARCYGELVMSKSVNQANINGTKLKTYPIPLPPLAEQERIVSILDKAFEGIDKAIAQTEQNLASARELFESYLNNIFTQKGDDWVEKKLGEVCENLDRKRIPITKSKREAGDIPYYGASGVVDYVKDYIFDEEL
ncbi:restriction endonuclease subunit S, partial [Akkermansiaceae bacterium]|nr:restriction endonuclease subunit S [Akkermansiaceae bacterium]